MKFIVDWWKRHRKASWEIEEWDDRKASKWDRWRSKEKNKGGYGRRSE